jgi:hypothetical protein
VTNGESETLQPTEGSIDDDTTPIHESETPQPADGSPESDISRIHVLRVRHFFEFDTPFVLKRTEEVTLYNSGEETRRIVHNAREFLPHLNFLDSDGKKLVFHGELEDYGLDSNEEDVDVETDEDSDIPIEEDIEDIYPIIIEFPPGRPFSEREVRIITLSYIKEVEFDNGVPIISIPLEVAPHFYLYIKKLSEFNVKIGYLLESSDNQRFRLHDLSDDEFDSIEIKDTIGYSSFSSQMAIEDCKLLVGLNYELFPWDKRWFFGGILLAVIAFLINIFLILMNVQSNFTSIIAITGIVNSYLIITKGWIFMKNMDKPVGFPYTTVYLALIILLFLEVILAILLSVFDFNFSQNLHFMIDQQIKMNVTL